MYFVDNSALSGGGMRLENNASLTMTRSLFSGNYILNIKEQLPRLILV